MICPAEKFKFDPAVGRGEPVGKRVRNDGAVDSTAVTFSTTAVAVIGAGSEPPSYLLELVEGPEHAPLFVTVVIVDGEIAGRGKGNTKKAAQQASASEALKRMFPIHNQPITSYLTINPVGLIPELLLIQKEKPNQQKAA